MFSEIFPGIISKLLPPFNLKRPEYPTDQLSPPPHTHRWQPQIPEAQPLISAAAVHYYREISITHCNTLLDDSVLH